MSVSRVSGGWGRFSEDLSDVLEAQILMNKRKTVSEIMRIIKSNPGIHGMMREEGMTDSDLREMVQENLSMVASIRCERSAALELMRVAKTLMALGVPEYVADMDQVKSLKDKFVARLSVTKTKPLKDYLLEVRPSDTVEALSRAWATVVLAGNDSSVDRDEMVSLAGKMVARLGPAKGRPIRLYGLELKPSDTVEKLAEAWATVLLAQ